MSTEETKYFMDNLEVVFNSGVPDVRFKVDSNLAFWKEADEKTDIKNYVCWGINSALYKVFNYMDRTIGIEVYTNTSDVVRIFFSEFVDSTCCRSCAFIKEAKKGEVYAQ